MDTEYYKGGKLIVFCFVLFFFKKLDLTKF